MADITVALFGYIGCGKTTYVNNFFPVKTTEEGLWEKHIIDFHGSVNKRIFDFQCTIEVNHTNGKRDGVILMFDLNNSYSFYDSLGRLLCIRLASPNIPVVVCGNKADLYKIKTDYRAKLNEFLRRLPGGGDRVEYREISSKEFYNYFDEEPLAYLFKKIFGDDFDFEEDLKPPPFYVDLEDYDIDSIEAEMKKAWNTPLPIEEDRDHSDILYDFKELAENFGGLTLRAKL